jgi:hypothetical protein
MPLPALIVLLVVGCRPEYETHAQSRALLTHQATFDVGLVAVEDTETLRIFVASTGQAAVTLHGIELEDDSVFTLLDSWKVDDLDGDGLPDGQIIEGGSLGDPHYGLVELEFTPPRVGAWRTTLSFISDDTEVTERTAENLGLWRVVLRGIGVYPCIQVYPVLHDLGQRPVGGYYSTEITFENCGNVRVTVGDLVADGSEEIGVETPMPIYVLPGVREPVEVGWIPGGSWSAITYFTPKTNDPDDATEVKVMGNVCQSSMDPTWDADGDGWFPCGADCDDDNPDANPSVAEIAGNGIDDDCDGDTDESPNNPNTDDDGDGFTEAKGDCHDADATVYPGAEELLNMIDDDCDGQVDEDTARSDDDGDGMAEREGDCNDADADIYPGAEERDNDIDDDCDGLIDEGGAEFDDDGDGFDEAGTQGEPDCNDVDAWSYPGAIEDCDGRDNDCDGEIDEGEDGEPGGACAFLVERLPVEVSTAPPQQCGTRAGTPMGWLGLLSVLGLVARRRP